MNLYLVERRDRIGYHEFDSFVCRAETESEARAMHPNDDGSPTLYSDGRVWPVGDRSTLVVTWIGEARTIITPGVVLASFNAG
jgi:hypothetical protein